MSYIYLIILDLWHILRLRKLILLEVIPLLEVSYFLNNHLNNGKKYAVYPDLSEAVDTINHNILIIKMEQVDIKECRLLF